MLACPREGCPCIYHGDEEIHITYHEGSSWCLKCGHRIKGWTESSLPLSSTQISQITRNPYLKTIQIIRPNATDGGNSDCPSEGLESPQRRESPAIVDMTRNVDEPEEKMERIRRDNHSRISGGKGLRPENKDGNGRPSEGSFPSPSLRTPLTKLPSGNAKGY